MLYDQDGQADEAAGSAVEYEGLLAILSCLEGRHAGFINWADSSIALQDAVSGRAASAEPGRLHNCHT